RHVPPVEAPDRSRVSYRSSHANLAVYFFYCFFFSDTTPTEFYTLSLHDALPICKHLAHNLGNLLLLGKIGVFHNRRNASSRLLLLISKHLILCIYLVFRILA